MAEALDEARRSVVTDPLSPARRISYAMVALGAGRYDLVAEESRWALSVQPTLAPAAALHARALLLLGRADRCLEQSVGPFLGVRAMCLHALGRRADAQRVADSLVAIFEGRLPADTLYSDAIVPQELVMYQAWIGDVTGCLRWLRAAFERSPVGIDPRLVASAIFDRVRGVPGFRQELKQLTDEAWQRLLRESTLLKATLVPHPSSGDTNNAR